MSSGNADRNLLLGILAHQNAFITKDQLLAGMQAWLYDKTKPLAEILRDQGALDEPCRALLDALVDRHVKQHGGDPQQSLRAISSASSVRHDLEGLPDPDLQASIGHLPPSPSGRGAGGEGAEIDPYATQSQAAGTGTSEGTRFRILRPHAKGGLGEVFVALDTELNREVALKEIQDKHADDKNSRARFLLEAEITGGLEHPSIVPVYGLGTYADGRPFYAMRFIRGDSLQDAIKNYHKSPGTAVPGPSEGTRTVELHKLIRRLIDVCNALQYAHDRGVLHRDIKPGNIMLGKYGETLVVDWGLAKAAGAQWPVSGDPEASTIQAEAPLHPANASGSAETMAGTAIGTPAYMSPEQAEGRLDILGPATDVYSLGATLYTLLTGKPPAKGSLDEVLKKVRTGDITPPRRLDPTIDAALEAVCLKAMALRPADRYASPRQMADDVEHWLAGEPVSAWPEPITIKLRRWVGRHKTSVAAAASLLVAALPLLTVLIVLSEGARVDLEKEQGKTKDTLALAINNEGLADQRRQEAVKLAEANKLLAEEANRRREQAEALALRIQFEHYFTKAEDRPDLALVGMASLLPKAARLKDPALADSLHLQIGAWSRQVARLHAICVHQGDVVAVALSADGKTALTGNEDKTARLWDTATGTQIGPPLQHQDVVYAVALSADGKTALTGSRDSTARLWRTATGKPIGPPLEHHSGVCAVALSADGMTSLTGSYDKTARLWATATGKPIGPPLQHQGFVVAVALSADGKTALTGSWDNTARVWETATGKPIGSPLQHQGGVNAVALSADGKTALTGCKDNAAHLWETVKGKPIGPPLAHQADVVAVALSADGKTALTGSWDKTGRLWETASGKPIGPPLHHENFVVAVALSTDGKTALTGGDATARLWDAVTGKPSSPPLHHQYSTRAVALSADGKTALTASADKTARLWESAPGNPSRVTVKHKDRIRAVALSADGKTALTGSWDRTARVWEMETGKPIGPLLQHQGVIRAVALSADGTAALLACDSGPEQLWATATGKPIGPPLERQAVVRAVALSADGKTALTGGDNSVARLWETATGKPIGPPLQHQGAVSVVALSADGKMALIGGENWAAQLWDLRTGNPIGPLLKHQGGVFAVALNGDGKTALTGGGDKMARLWETSTGRPIGPPLQHQDEVCAVSLSADGKIALTGSKDKTARLWETTTGKPIGPPWQHQDTVWGVALSADGKTALTGCEDKTARLWHIPQPMRGDPERIMLWTQVITGLEVDELTAVHVLDAATWQQRRQRLQELGGPPD